MGAIPSSELPGHKQLHERVCAAIDRCQETQDIEFKESASWETLKFKIIRTALGMGNLRDGGIIVIGVSERNHVWKRTGIRSEHLATYDSDVLVDQINAYVSPYVDLDVVLVKHQELRYLSIYVHEFRETPLVCKKNGPDNEEMHKGHLYIRTPGKPQTTRVLDANQMHDLLDLAVEKRVRRLIEMFRQMGIADAARADAQKAEMRKFDEELGGL